MDHMRLAAGALGACLMASFIGPPGRVSSGSWLALAALSDPRQEVAVAELGGRIYVIGGLRGDRSTADTVEVYDPAADRWTLAAPLPLPLHHAGAAAVNGKLYVIGGFTGLAFLPVSAVFEYSPPENRWSGRASMPTARGALAVGVVDGRIYAAGGSPVDRETDLAVYDPVADRWTQLPSMPTRRNHLAAAGIGGKFYAAGGRSDAVPGVSNVLEEYDPSANRWATKAPMPTGRGGIAGAAADGCLYVFGGEGNPNHPAGVFEQTEVYDPRTNAWERLAAMSTPRHGIGAAAVGSRIFVPGGATVQGLGVTGVHEAFQTDRSCVPLPSVTMGGRGFGLRIGGPSGPGVPEGSWTGGMAQTGYRLLRLSRSGSAVLPPDGAPLPASATSYSDTSTLTDPAYCYTVLPLGPAGPVGNSDLLCGFPGTRSLSWVPSGFTIRLNESSRASLTWAPPECPAVCAALAVDGYVLVVLGGRGVAIGPLPGSATAATHDTGGLPTCYVVVALSGSTPIGNTDALCGLPGLSRLGTG